MGKTDSSTSRGLFRRFSSRRSRAEAVGADTHSPIAGSSTASPADFHGSAHSTQRQTPKNEETHATSRVSPVGLVKHVPMLDIPQEVGHNRQDRPRSLMTATDSLSHGHTLPSPPLPHIGSISPVSSISTQTTDSQDRIPTRRRSRAMQQMLKERAASSPLSPLSPTEKSLTSTQRSVVASPGEELNGLKRKQSISPAAKDYVAVATTAYTSKLNRRKALLIGIGYRNHSHLHVLPGCKNDVRSMFELLTSDMFNFPKDSVRVLSDELENIGSVRVEAPTRFNILRQMVWLTDDVHEGDSVVFFFAGHGDFIEDVSGDEVETGVDQCIMPVDFMPEPKHATGKTFKGVPPILDDTIYERLVRGVPSGAKVTAIVDACRSGSVCDLPVMHVEDGVRYRPGGSKPPRERRSPHKAAGGFVLFSGSADHQLSVDMTVPKSGTEGEVESFGVMTKSFVDAAREMALTRCADTYDGLEPWTYGQLFERVKELVRDRTRRILPFYVEQQEPQMSTSHVFDIWTTPFTI